MIKVCKFGGTSMADGNIIKRVASIVKSDENRRYIVVSAPGKRFGDDVKVTDILIKCFYEALSTGSCASNFAKIRARFKGIVEELGSKIDIDAALDETEKRILYEKSYDFTVSRGEYLSGLIMSDYLGWPYIDAQGVIIFRQDGTLDSEGTYKLLGEALKGKKNAVVAGFYGSDSNGNVKTFSRGGSDISGAIVARVAGADVYENWTDVSGFMACDPRIVSYASVIKTLSYRELRELSYMGANVLHSEAIFPVKGANIPINIKNTFSPDDDGTMIVPITQYKYTGNIVTGIAGKKDFTVILIEKSMMNSEVGFFRRVLTILENYGVSFEHIPSGIDTMSVVIDSAALKNGVLDKILSDVEMQLNPDHIRIYNDIALIATVGHGMSSSIGTSGRLFKALSDANINVRMIDQGSSELNIIVGVNNADCNKAIKAIYDEFFPGGKE